MFQCVKGICLLSGDALLGLSPAADGESSLAGVVSASLGQSGSGGPGTGLQEECGLDHRLLISNSNYNWWRHSHNCYGVCLRLLVEFKHNSRFKYIYISPFLIHQRTDSELHDAFVTIAEFMTQTTHGCKVSEGFPPDGASNHELWSCWFYGWFRGFMSPAVALIPATLRGSTCPGSTWVQELRGSRLHGRPEDKYVA